MISWDGLGVALFQGVVVQSHGQVPHQEKQEEEVEEQRGTKEQRGTLASHGYFPTELADVDFF